MSIEHFYLVAELNDTPKIGYVTIPYVSLNIT